MFTLSILNCLILTRVKMTCFNSHLGKIGWGKAFPSLQLASDLPLPLLTRGPYPLVTLPSLVIILLLSPPALGATLNQKQPMIRIAGPIEAIVLHVIDGDTVEVMAYTWPDEMKRVRIRIPDIQAPESTERGAKCEAERTAGLRAKSYLSQRLPEGATVSLIDIRPGKYARRMIARMLDSSGKDIATALVETGHALPWLYKQPKPSFCP